jgi:hypothetical protein
MCECDHSISFILVHPMQQQLAFAQLDQLWHASSRNTVVILAKGTPMWHCGRIPSLQELDDERALWSTRDPSRSDDYAGWAREPATWTQLPPTKLELQTQRDLKTADFALRSLRQFTEDYCQCQHDLMKRTVRAWALLRGLDGVVRANSDENEVMIVRPKSDLILSAATPL